MYGCRSARDGSAVACSASRWIVKSSWIGIGFSVHRVPSLSNTATRSVVGHEGVDAPSSRDRGDELGDGLTRGGVGPRGEQASPVMSAPFTRCRHRAEPLGRPRGRWGGARPAASISSHRGVLRAVASDRGGSAAIQSSTSRAGSSSLDLLELVDHRHRQQGDGGGVDDDELGRGSAGVDGRDQAPVRRAHVGRVERPVEAQDQQARAPARWSVRPASRSSPPRAGWSSVSWILSSSTITSTRVRTTPIATASRSPRASPLTAVTIATQNSMRLSCQKRTNSAGLIRPSTATITRQPRVASGRSLSTPARNSAQPTARTTVTSSLSWVRGAGPLVDGGLGEPARRRHRLEERAGDAGHAVGGQLLVVVDRRLARAAGRSRATDGRLEEAHERDGDGPRRHHARGGRTTAPGGTAGRRAPARSAPRRARRGRRRPRGRSPPPRR